MLGIYPLLLFLLICQRSDARCWPKTDGIYLFGPNCEYMCHCRNNDQCRETTGECRSGCARFWYGPGCQYRDIAEGELSRHSDNLQPGPKYSFLANDGDTRTCSYTAEVGSSEKKVKPFWRVWFPANETIRELQIVTLREILSNFKRFSVLVEYLSPAEKETLDYAPSYSGECYKHGDDAPNNATFTVLCTTPVVGNQVRIELDALKTQLVLCDVRINGGRNLAFGRKTSQSSRHLDCKRRECLPDKAVNGEVTRHWRQCSYTADEKNPWWKVDLEHIMAIWYIRILPRKAQTSSYEIKVSNDTQELGRPIYDVDAIKSAKINITLKTITKSVKLTRKAKKKRLAICEAYVFGDCLEDTCGYECSVKCHCKRATIWDKTSGRCSYGCKDGWTGPRCDMQDTGCDNGTFGPDCKNTCSPNCFEDDICDKVDGQCPRGCKAGFTGNTCQQNCKIGFYGPNCSHSCSAHCEGGPKMCSNIDGRCLKGCKAGWKGTKCISECSAGSYGTNCSKTCSAHCEHGYAKCSIIDGSCLSDCNAGWNGKRCDQKCDKGRFGRRCMDTCPVNCKHGDVCNATNGQCPDGCEPGYIGKTCAQNCTLGFYGDNCSNNCSDYCEGGPKLCSNIDGHCRNGCKVGWMGTNCNIECSAGSYGKNCSGNCTIHCEGGYAKCSKVDGSCSSGCKAGWNGKRCDQNCSVGFYGDNCSHNCSDYCEGGPKMCSNVDGHCRNGCQDSWMGTNCDIGCVNGTFGPDCKNTCSPNCFEDDICDKVHGQCPRGCKPGFTGNTCEKNCKYGFYGPNCSHICSAHCEGGPTMCSNIDGRCLKGCKAGWKGTKCNSECNGGFYGINCASICGNCKSGTVCHKVVGACSEGCETGYSGDNCLQVMQKSDTSNSEAATAGGVVSLVIGIVIVVAVTAVIYRRRKRSSQRKDEPSVDVELTVSQRNREKERKKKLTNVHLNAGTTTNAEANSLSTGEVNIYNNDRDVGQTKTAISIANLLAYTKGNLAKTGYFLKEFQEIPFGMKQPSTVGIKPCNKGKNKYKDLQAYDHTRVVLNTLSKEQGTDYINASFIKGYAKDQAYIAAQGPMKSTVNDFWRMIWEQNIYTIAMVTNVVEEGKRKCLQYWPTFESSTRYGDFTVYTESEAIYAEFTIRKFKVSFKGKPSRNIRQFHFTAWPDKSVPRSTSSLLQFWTKVRNNDENKSHTWLVHCSAGVGRTGTFIATDILYDQGKDNGFVDVYQCVRDLRDQRVNMVQTKDQYIFLHGMMIEAFVLPSEPVTLDNFHQVLNDLKDFDVTKRRTKLRLQYETLKEDVTNLCDKADTEDMYTAAMLKENRQKNRCSSILAPNEFRPFLITSIPGCTNYINAVYIPSYFDIHGYIISQIPLKTTAIDCCRLVYEQEVKVIVTFPTNVKDQTGTYLPAHGTINLGPFTMTKLSEEDKHFYKKKKYVMAYNSEEYELTQLVFKYWPEGRIIPSDPINMLKFMQEVEYNKRVADNKPVLVQCLDGSERSGLFVVLMNILERARLDNEVSIPQVIRQLRIRRQQLIPNVEQFKFCYDVLLCHVESDTVYANA